MRLFDLLKKSFRKTGDTAWQGRSVFAFGDVHGCADLLDVLLGAISARTAGDSPPPLFIFLGDYVDRGPASRQVIDMLLAVRTQYPDARFLCGNHEEAMLRFLVDFDDGLAWTSFGGRETLRSYGVEPPRQDTDIDAWRQAQEAFKAAIPEEHLRFLWGLEDRVEVGDYLFVHAGVRPDRPLEAQITQDLRWIREPFLSHPRRLAKVIVHGHTPRSEPFSDERRVGVDTWAYRTGALTALELNDAGRGFWQARRQGAKVAVDHWQAGDASPWSLATEA